jgi:TRAP-type C4-dicarboxylate transport system permease small subunit
LKSTSVVGLASYGNPCGGAGYLWTQSGQLFVDTAVDFAPAGQQQVYAAVVNPACVSSGFVLNFAHRSVLQRTR